MRLLSLTDEPALLRRVGTIFADLILELDSYEDPWQFLEASVNKPFDVLFVDFDALSESFADPMNFLERIGPNKRILMIGSSTLAEWHHELRNYGAMVLHKPTTAGEIGLALLRLMSERKLHARVG